MSISVWESVQLDSISCECVCVLAAEAVLTYTLTAHSAHSSINGGLSRRGVVDTGNGGEREKGGEGGGGRVRGSKLKSNWIRKRMETKVGIMGAK